MISGYKKTKFHHGSSFAQYPTVTGAGYAHRHLLPQYCVVTTPAMKATASTIA